MSGNRRNSNADPSAFALPANRITGVETIAVCVRQAESAVCAEDGRSSLNVSNLVGGISKLPTPLRKPAASIKYAESVRLYATTTLHACEIAEKCGVTAAGLGAHISRYHRDLLFKRCCLDPSDENLQKIRVKSPLGQSLISHLKYKEAIEKYKEAIEACGDMAYIEYNVSQVSAMFDLDGVALAARQGIVYNSIPGFIERNCPETQESHRRVVAKSITK